MTARHIICTEYKWEDPEDYLRQQSKKCDYVCGQLEKCPTTGRIHLQWAAYSSKALRWGWIKCTKVFQKYGKGDVMLAYAMKEETRIEGPWEFGTKPQKTTEKGGRPKNLEIINGDLRQMVDDDKIRLTDLKKIKEAITIYHSLPKKYINDQEKTQDPRESGPCITGRGLWYYGKPRTGKTTKARENAPYIKGRHKWWDGYLGQEEVALDDIEIGDDKVFGHYLKVWADVHPFQAETKHGAIEVSIKKFIVTSNYSIDDIFAGFGKDEMLYEAIKSRYTEIRFDQN